MRRPTPEELLMLLSADQAVNRMLSPTWDDLVDLQRDLAAAADSAAEAAGKVLSKLDRLNNDGLPDPSSLSYPVERIEIPIELYRRLDRLIAGLILKRPVPKINSQLLHYAMVQEAHYVRGLTWPASYQHVSQALADTPYAAKPSTVKASYVAENKQRRLVHKN
jgi:hypothetical protein